MTDSSRAQGGLICAGTLLVGLIFAAGLLSKSWWAVAIPVALLLAFVLGLVFWVGWTIMSVDLEPELERPAETTSQPAETEAED